MVLEKVAGNTWTEQTSNEEVLRRKKEWWKRNTGARERKADELLVM